MNLKLFTDGSVDPQSHIGYGAYLMVVQNGLSLASLGQRVKLKRFEPTSSTKLELQTLLWAMADANVWGQRVWVYTDSQNIIGLLGRRGRLEKNGYQSKKRERIFNCELYQEFYRRMDRVDCEFIKVRGHEASHQKGEIGRLFSLVDKASRNALRKETR